MGLSLLLDFIRKKIAEFWGCFFFVGFFLSVHSPILLCGFSITSPPDQDNIKHLMLWEGRREKAIPKLFYSYCV